MAKSKVQVIRLGDQQPAQTQYHSGTKWLNYDHNPGDNLYPQYLLSLMRSVTHNAILQLKQNMIVGRGFIVPADQSNTRVFLDNINEEYGGYELLERTALDLAVFGGFAWQVRWNALGTRIHSIKHVPFQMVRWQMPDHTTGLSNEFWIAERWGIGSPDPNDPDYYGNQYGGVPLLVPKTIPLFDENNRKVSEPSLVYYRQHNGLNQYYPVPDYYACLNDVQVDIAISIFNKNNVNYGFVPSVFIGLPDSASDDEMDLLVKELQKKFTGVHNASQLLIVKGGKDGEGGTLLPTFQPFTTTNNADIYKELTNSTMQRIVSGHKLSSPVIAGLPGSGGLGGNANEIKEANDQFYNSVIKKYQRRITEQLNKLLSINGLYNQVELGRDQEYNNLPDMNQQYITINEQRMRAGLKEIENDPRVNIPIGLLNNSVPTNEPSPIQPNNAGQPTGNV